jgi:hypothetical protein
LQSSLQLISFEICRAPLVPLPSPSEFPSTCSGSACPVYLPVLGVVPVTFRQPEPLSASLEVSFPLTFNGVGSTLFLGLPYPARSALEVCLPPQRLPSPCSSRGCFTPKRLWDSPYRAFPSERLVAPLEAPSLLAVTRHHLQLGSAPPRPG